MVRPRHSPALGQRGFVLVVVLWTVALLALVGAHITAGARAALAEASALRNAAIAGATADGLVREAIFHLLDPSARGWRADGIARRVTLSRGHGEVEVSNELGRINPNVASPDLLASLMTALGVPKALANQLGITIYEWHVGRAGDPVKYRAAQLGYGPPGQGFTDAADLVLIAGMKADIAAAMIPLLSVHTDGRIDLDAASPVVRRAVTGMPQAQRPPPPEAGGAQVLRIRVRATLPEAQAAREAIVRIDLAEEDAAGCCEILSWKQALEGW